MDKQVPMVSVCMITYSHEKYIAQAIEGVIMQQTTFPIELIIGEDCSTDTTRKICLDYQSNYPELIKVRLPEKNIGMMRNFVETMEAGSGKYIALCEGDDYWTDPLKLQKQVDFMESNISFSMISHRYNILDQENNTILQDFSASLFNESVEGLVYTKDSYLEHPFAQTMTVLVRKSMFDLELLRKINQGDMALFYCCLKNGDGYCLNYNSAVYRLHSGGVYSKRSEYQKIRAGLYLYQKLYCVTKDVIFLKHMRSHSILLFGKIKEHIISHQPNSTFWSDLCLLIKVDFKERKYNSILLKFRKVIYWNFKYRGNEIKN